MAKDFEKLRQLILVEEFKACVPTSIKTYIDKQKATTLHQAALFADDYSLTHRNAFLPSNGSGSTGSSNDKSMTLPSYLRTSYGRHRNQHDNIRNANRSHPVVCNYCKYKGHVVAECWLLQQKKKPDTFVHTMNEPLRLSGAVVDSKLLVAPESY